MVSKIWSEMDFLPHHIQTRIVLDTDSAACLCHSSEFRVPTGQTLGPPHGSLQPSLALIPDSRAGGGDSLDAVSQLTTVEKVFR